MEIGIRDVRLEDAERLVEIYRYYVEKTAITFEYETPSVEEYEGRIRQITEKYPYLVLLADGKIEGYAYAGTFKGRVAYDWAVELTIYLDHTAEKKGFGRKLYQALEDRLRAMGITNLYACITYPQTPDDPYASTNSADFHGHLGFKECGRFHSCGYKFSRWYDMIWSEKFIAEHKVPQPPVSFGAAGEHKCVYDVPQPPVKFEAAGERKRASECR